MIKLTYEEIMSWKNEKLTVKIFLLCKLISNVIRISYNQIDYIKHITRKCGFFSLFLVMIVVIFNIITQQLLSLLFFIIFVTSIIFFLIPSTIKTLHDGFTSVKFHIKFLVFNNIIISLYSSSIITGIFNPKHTGIVWSILFFVIFSLVWVSFSLMADPKVARLSNEIISGFLGLIFTIATYFVSFYQDYIAIPISVLVGLFLPFIVLSMLSIIAVNCKEYWEEKYNQ